MNNILINASNLHVGGGVQVAASFILELSLIIKSNPILFREKKISVFLSTCVMSNISTDCDTSIFDIFKIVDVFGREKNNLICSNTFSDYDLVFTIFGPLYFTTRGTKTITGFAQAWIAYPNNLAFKELSFLNKFKSNLTYKIKEFFFKKSDYLIVEAKHVKDALIIRGYDKNKIFIVNNTVSSVFYDSDIWKKIPFSKRDKFTLGFIGRSYSHKNIKILKDVNEKLIEHYNINCDFLFTLTEDEMNDNDFSKIENFHSVGPVSVEQCPDFYNKIDALIFPSLLECYSATPIEAMKMSTLVIASDLPFVTGICESSARYFNPKSVDSIAYQIYLAVSEPEENLKLINKAQFLVEKLPSAKDRAEAYLDIISNLK